MLHDDEEYFSHENEVFEEFVRQLNEAMALGINYVIADATHLSGNSINKLLRRLKPDCCTNIQIRFINTPLALVLERNAKRKGRTKVPSEKIKQMYKYFHPERIVVDKHKFNDVSYMMINC